MCGNVHGIMFRILFPHRSAAEAAMEDAYHTPLPKPWVREAALTRHLMQDGAVNGDARLHKFDAWHALHLGVGKSWIAGSMMLVQAIVPGNNIDVRIELLCSEYRSFCRREKLNLHLNRFDKHTFSGGNGTEPSGTWNKASTTSTLMLFLEWACEHWAEEVRQDERLRIVVACLMGRVVIETHSIKKEVLPHLLFGLTEAYGTSKVNQFMRGVYQHDCWIPASDALPLASALFAFLRAYFYEAHLSYRTCEESKFALFPKLHALHHIAWLMRRQGETCSHVLNPAVEICSIDEDFVGRKAVLTRSVSPRLMALRSIQRYLAQIQVAWSRAVD